MEKMVKIVVFVPKTHTDVVRKAVGDAGAGKIGLYSHCSFSSDGVGRYIPMDGSHPIIGEIGTPEEVIEERIEFVCERAKAKEIIRVMREVHPYDEVAFDIYPLVLEEEL